MNKLVTSRTLALACTCVTLCSSAASAQLSVGHVTVVHTDTVTAPFYTSTPTTVIDSNTTGGVFDTQASTGLVTGGVIANLSPTGGSVWMGTLGGPITPASYHMVTPSGSIALHLASGSLLPSISIPDTHISVDSGLGFRLTDVATGQYWNVGLSPYNGGNSGGNTTGSTLAVPVGPGDYVLSFSSSQFGNGGHSQPSHALLNLTVVPEPTSLMAAGALLHGLARRPRRASRT